MPSVEVKTDFGDWKVGGADLNGLAEQVYRVWQDGGLRAIRHENGIECPIPYEDEDGNYIDDGNVITGIVMNFLTDQNVEVVEIPQSNFDEVKEAVDELASIANAEIHPLDYGAYSSICHWLGKIETALDLGDD